MGSLRLNLMCGDDYLDGWTNIDLRTDVRAELVADATDLVWWADGTVDEIRAMDGLEHFPKARIPAVLGEWARVLRPGGRLHLRVPNLAVLARQLVQGVRLELTIENIYGGHRWGPDGAWDCHHTGWVPRTLATDLLAAGFKVESNNNLANMTVVAVRK